MATNESKNNWYTTKEAAKELGVTVDTIRSYCQRGLLSYRELSNGHIHYLIDPISILKFTKKFHGKRAKVTE